MISLLINLLSLVAGVDSVGAAPKAELVFVGDAMQHQSQLDKALQLGGDQYQFADCFSLISPAIRDADYAVCNLEVPLGGSDFSGYPCFNAPDSYVIALADAGFDMMLTANNHCLDRSDRAARRTLNVLDSLGIDHVGTFRSTHERDSLVPFIKDINGFKIAFLNYTYGTNGIEPRDGVEVALIDRDRIKHEIGLAKSGGAEIIVVAMHWGIEYILVENKIQKDLAQFLIDCGADMIIGGHPHVIQPMEVVRNDKEEKDVLVVYSLGNFISNMNTADTCGGAILWTTIVRDENGKARFHNADYDLIYAAKPENGSNFQVIPGWQEELIPKNQFNKWKLFERGATKIFDKYNVNVNRRSQKLLLDDSGK